MIRISASRPPPMYMTTSFDLILRSAT
jgi:hypothetical protein